ncbi:MAG: murein biosynthesis integral membrane protein MurJ [Eggerthellaceae bacterium]|nr:murein biosynthesis integral membrane protein MurJ [Eggerthellaceae bacterium]
MSDKLKRAQHTKDKREPRKGEDDTSLGARVDERIGDLEGEVSRGPEVPGEFGEIESEEALETLEEQKEEAGESAAASVGRSAALISICVIISRVTGFARTWAMAFALGATFVSSSYQVANNLPNMLYELVMGGMLVTAFLPVYLSIKKKLGNERGNDYASNLLSIVVVLLVIVSILCMIFPAQIIYTQSFYSEQDTLSLAVFFFQLFAIQIIFYGCSSIISGLLNANREYFWSSIAPVFNNLIVIASFLLYAFLAENNPTIAYYAIAIGNPLGVFVQMAIQVPALRKNGIRIRPRIALHDPALKDTLALGAPAIFVTICSFATVSAQTAASYVFADNGPSVIAYARLWFTFPYSFLAVPVSTAMFTELSDMQADGNTKGVIRGITEGSAQIAFLMIPMMFYLIAFSTPLVTLYHIGAFTEESISQIASYLAVMAVALPFYGVNSYLNKVFSSIRRMGIFSIVNFVAVAAQVGVTVGAALLAQNGFPVTLEAIAASTIVSYVIGDVVAFIYLHHHYGHMGLGFLGKACLRSILLGGLGAIAGALVLWGLESAFGALSGSLIQALIYIIVGGVVALAVTFIPAILLNLPEAAFVTNLAHRLARRLKRR